MEYLEQVASEDTAVRLVLLYTAITLAPAILLSLSSFIRIIIVLTFIKTALGAQNTPPQQVLIALALFITAAVMAPTLQELNDEALRPYLNGRLELGQALSRAEAPVRGFLTRNVRKDILQTFHETSREPLPNDIDSVSMSLLVPSFVASELQTAFELGFLIFLPFLVIDVLTASVLMAMGMVMLPPSMISLPLKLLLFVAADGWALMVTSMFRSFA